MASVKRCDRVTLTGTVLKIHEGCRHACRPGLVSVRVDGPAGEPVPIITVHVGSLRHVKAVKDGGKRR